MANLKINTQDNVYNIQCEEGETLKDIIKNNNINFIFPCGARGRCGNCKVKVLKGVDKPTSLDNIKLSQIELKDNFRLACCIFVKQDMEIFLKEFNEFNLL